MVGHHQCAVMLKDRPCCQYALSSRCSFELFIFITFCTILIVTFEWKFVPHDEITVNIHIVPYVTERLVRAIITNSCQELFFCNNYQTITAGTNIL